MRKLFIWLVPFIILAGFLALYLYPGPKTTYEEVYAQVDTETVTSLLNFREQHPPETIGVNGMPWEYASLGEGEETVLFLHGMTGAYDIWWRQTEMLKEDYRLISVTYPPLDSLEEMAAGIMTILDHEGVDQVNVVGSSLGGYLAQYLVAKHPDRILRAVFANTFPPNDLLAEQNRTIGALLPYLPEWLVMSVLRNSFRESIYPASGYNELVLAYLQEIAYGRMSKSDVIGRYRCVIEPFEPAHVEAMGLPVLIIEASNDPLVEPILREQLKETYPTAKAISLGDVGHFPYLNEPEEFALQLRRFLEE